MQNELDIKLALNAFNVITKHGDKQDVNYHYQGLQAWSDFDGYTLQIANNKVTLTIYFHNKYHFDYDSDEELDKFIKVLKKLAL